MQTIFGLDFETFVLFFSLLGLLLLLTAIEFWIFITIKGTKYSDQSIQIRHYSHIIFGSPENLQQETKLKTLNKDNLKLPTVISKKTPKMLNSFKTKIYSQEWLAVSIGYVLMVFLLIFLMPVIIVLQLILTLVFLVGGKDYFITYRAQRELFVIFALIIGIISLLYVLSGLTGEDALGLQYIAVTSLAYRIVPELGLIGLSTGTILLFGLIGMLGSTLMFITMIWNQFKWKYFWKRHFLDKMNQVLLNTEGLDRYLQLKTFYDTIDQEPTILYFKELAAIGLFLGFIQILAPTIGNIFGFL